MKQNIGKGALHGLLAWLCYGVVEFLLAYGVPRFWRPDIAIIGWQWGSIGVTLAVYAAAGLLLGGAGGALLAWSARNSREGAFGTVAGLTLIAAFTANLMAAWPLARSEQLALAVAVLLAGILIAALFSDAWRRRSASFTNPVALSLLLLACPWLSREALYEWSGLMKTGACLAALLAIVASAALLHRLAAQGAARRAITAIATILVFWAVAQISGLTWAAHTEAASSSTAKGPNVLLITMDTVRADHLSLYGYARPTTPNLARFAAEATVYDHAFAAGDFTLPSHASIFTGLYPAWHGAYPSHPDFIAGRPLQAGAKTMARLLSSQGYWTGGIFANAAFLQSGTGLNQGFGMWQTARPVLLSDLERPFYLREGVRRLLDLVAHTGHFDAMFLRAADINSRTYKVLDGMSGHKPFFLFLNYMDAHFPYVPPAEFRDRFPAQRAHLRPMTAYKEMDNSINTGQRQITKVERDSLIASYDGGIAYMDSEIGNLMDRLRSMGLYDDTLIIVTSDHGEAFGDHDLIGHTVTSLFQDGSHIPLLVKLPGQHEARRSADVVSQVDLMPTVLETVGQPLPPGLQGRPLSSPRSPSDVVYGEAHAIGEHDRNARLRGVRRAAFTASSKLIMWTGGPPEFYNLAVDPGESHSRYDAKDPVVAALQASLTEWTASIPKQLSKPTKLDKETVDRIRSLGYIQK